MLIDGDLKCDILININEITLGYYRANLQITGKEAIGLISTDMLAAKSRHQTPGMWLPFSAHSRDSAGIMERLYWKWLPDAVRRTLAASIRLHSDWEETLAQYCRLLALLHDIGKLTPSFQQKLAACMPEYAERLSSAGIDLSGLEESKRSPHAAAGGRSCWSTAFRPPSSRSSVRITGGISAIRPISSGSIPKTTTGTKAAAVPYGGSCCRNGSCALCGKPALRQMRCPCRMFRADDPDRHADHGGLDRQQRDLFPVYSLR